MEREHCALEATGQMNVIASFAYLFQLEHIAAVFGGGQQDRILPYKAHKALNELVHTQCGGHDLQTRRVPERLDLRRKPCTVNGAASPGAHISADGSSPDLHRVDSTFCLADRTRC